MDSVFTVFRVASVPGQENGTFLASTITPEATPQYPNRLRDIVQSSDESRIVNDVRYATVYDSTLGLSKAQAQAWQEIYVAFWYTLKKIVIAEDFSGQITAQVVPWRDVYYSWKNVVDAIIGAYSRDLFEIWTIPCLYVAGRFLRRFAIKADRQLALIRGNVSYDGLEDDISDGTECQRTLEDAAGILMRMFSLCSNDRAAIEESRKWGIYNTANLLLKTYFKLDKLNLTRSILRPFSTAIADMPPLEAYPKSHTVTFKYYVGIISFMEENYALANEHLTYAYKACPRSSLAHRQLILTYLIPCHLHLHRTLPSKALLASYPNLQRLFLPLCTAIRKGDLAGFDAALSEGQDEFVRRRIYLTLERGRDVCLRNVFRKVFLAAGDEPSAEPGETKKRTRIKVDEFLAGLRLSMSEVESAELDRDEVECLIANCIYKVSWLPFSSAAQSYGLNGHHNTKLKLYRKGLLKGYISRQHETVVLSGKGAFPGTNV